MTAAALLRNDLATLTGLASRDLNVIWQQVSTAALAAEALNDVLPSLVATYGSAAATLAADWYDDVRDEAGAARRFTAIPADIPDPGTGALVGWATTTATDLSALKVLVDGGMQRRIANFSRLTVTGSSIADPSAQGWKRVGLGRCNFCRMLIGRGAVYREATADFKCHDHCACGAEPDFT